MPAWVSPPCVHFARRGRLRRALATVRGHLRLFFARRRLIRFAMRSYRLSRPAAVIYVDAVIGAYGAVMRAGARAHLLDFVRAGLPGAGKDTP